MYEITRFAPDIALTGRYQTALTDGRRADLDAEYEAAKEKAKGADSLKRLRELFEKDPIKRLAGAGELVRKWKTEYRNMM